jgi:KDO2-lipid IV(A) lauroyltransferase
VGYCLIKVLPIRVCYFLADVIAYLYYLCARRDIGELRANLKIVLGENAGEKMIRKNIRGVFRNFARYLADFMKYSRFTEDYINEKIKVEGTEILDECLSRGKGIIVLAPHLGNWEMGASVVATLGYPISAIVLEHKDKRINDFFMKRRAVHNLKLIPLGMQLKKCFKTLKDNEILAIAGDKAYSQNGEYVDFFGNKAFMPKGAAFFSLKTGAPIVTSALTREKNNTYKFVFEGPIKFEPTGDLEKDIKELMTRSLSKIEKYIREYPDQWYAFRKIWNHEPITR